MTLQELLKVQGLSDEQITTIVNQMKENKIYTSSEENLDVRYGKLKTDHEALTGKYSDAEKLIADLQKASKGQKDIQKKITTYEEQIAQKDAELEKVKIESALKVALLGAKAVDVDYLAYKIKEKGEEITLDDQGNIKNIDDMLAGLKTQFPSQFESTSQKKINENKLPDDDHKDTKVTKEEFEKMGYKSRVELRQQNPELYEELCK
ncbi:hypothetical protein P261_02271 [Lachnospiraceae bacterium TWA4]|nr:hypothetical protein P261_02271 [Lachnospiraceae bacterium TWA4]